MVDKYQLHSSGENWFHFRNDLESMIESFSITYCHDGTVCMTGDYGCLSWRREFFSDRPDYGFPSENTAIHYFAEKVVRAEEDQKIKTWKRELAISEIKETIEDYRADDNQKGIDVLNEMLERIDFFEEGQYGYIQMLEAFNGSDGSIDSETFYTFGRTFTDAFLFRFKVLTSVSSLVLATVNARNKAAVIK